MNRTLDPQLSTALELRHASTARAIVVVVPERRFVAIEGIGDPAAADFGYAGSALRTAIDAVRVRLRRDRLPVATSAGVLECLWTPPVGLPIPEIAAGMADRGAWHWCQVIEVPRAATADQVSAAIDETRWRAGRHVALVRRYAFTEGAAAQILHLGGRATEPASVRRLIDAIGEAGLRPAGRLHVLTLAAAPGEDARARAIIRLPVALPEG